MGFYVNLEMPKDCIVCPFGWNGCNNHHDFVYMGSRPDNCPLIPVPPHGRLIAEDDAIETAWMILAGLGYRREENPQLEQTVREVYATAPTVWVE